MASTRSPQLGHHLFVTKALADTVPFAGHWFDFSPVLVSTPATASDPPSPAPAPGPPTYSRFGTGEDEIYVFVCTRRPETLQLEVPIRDEALMSLTDDQFERLLMCEIDMD